MTKWVTNSSPSFLLIFHILPILCNYGILAIKYIYFGQYTYTCNSRIYGDYLILEVKATHSFTNSSSIVENGGWGARGPLHPLQYLADHLTLFQPGRLGPPITTGTSNFFHLPASLSSISSKTVWWIHKCLTLVDEKAGYIWVTLVFYQIEP